jgi:hypothetical protein
MERPVERTSRAGEGSGVIGHGDFQRTIQDQVGIAAVVRGFDDRVLVAGAGAGALTDSPHRTMFCRLSDLFFRKR